MDRDILRQLETYANLLRWARRRRWLTAGAAAGAAGLAVFAGYAISRPLHLVNQAAKLRLAMSGIRSRFIAVDGHQIHYYEGGPAATAGKPPVVLVHGLGGYAEHWTELMMQLVAAGRRVYALDLLGYGRSARPKEASYSIAQEAGIVEGFLRAKDIGDYDLCGWSMGGWIALQVALDQNHPAEKRMFSAQIRRLVLIDSAGLRYELHWDTDVFVPDTPEKLHALNHLLFPDSISLPGFLAEALMRQAREDGWVIQRSMDAMLTGQHAEDGKLRELTMPVLIVWGKEDRIVPVSVGERMHAAIPQSELEVYEGCGHIAPVKCASKIGPRMIAFLDAKTPEATAEAVL